MIPKIIHYCWYGGGQYSPLIRKCIKSWEKHLQGYQLKLWDENNTPIDHPFVKAAFEQKKYAFVADYMRFYVLEKYGGIYLDTDVLMMKNFDALLQSKCFLGVEEKDRVAGGVIGAVPNSIFIEKCLRIYDSLKFDPGKMDAFSIPVIMTKIYEQTSDRSEVTIYPEDYFYPLPFKDSLVKLPKLNKYIRPETICIHLWNASWVDELTQFRNQNKASSITKKIQHLRDRFFR